jgi:hypothetical protein
MGSADSRSWSVIDVNCCKANCWLSVRSPRSTVRSTVAPAILLESENIQNADKEQKEGTEERGHGTASTEY